MKRKCLLLTLILCLTLTACRTAQQPSAPPERPAEKQESRPANLTNAPKELDRITVELVVAWEEADRVLYELDALSGLLSGALLERGYAAEEVLVTISTAGGFTSGALAEGGVDIACMPALDYASCAEKADAILTTDEEIPTAVVAVSAAREDLGGDIRSALSETLTESGFLETCYPGAAYIPAQETSLQAIRDWAAEQDSHGE